MPGGGEVADVVVAEIGRRQAQALVAGGAVEGGCYAQFDAFRPDRIVVVFAVEAEHVVPHGKARAVGVVGGGGRHLAGHVAAEHADLRAQLPGDEFQFGDRLVGGVHRDDRRRGQPVAELGEIIGRDDVVGADHGAAGGVVLNARKAQPGGRVDDDEIEAELVEAVVKQARHHRGGAVERVLRLAAPERRLADALGAPLGGRHRQRVAGRPHRLQKAVRGQVAADLAHLVAEHRIVFDPMPVAIDDRMVDFRTNLFRTEMGAHGSAPEK